MSRRLGIVTTVLAAGMAVAVAAVAFSPPGTSDLPGPRLHLTSNALRVIQSQPNEALITLRNARAGQRAIASTQITLQGRRARVSVQARNLIDIAGPNGGKLISSGRLWIDVRCTYRRCPTPNVAYRGPLAEMGTRSLGTWAPGVTRTYFVRAWIRRSGTSPSPTQRDNVVQGAHAKFGLLWSAFAL